MPAKNLPEMTETETGVVNAKIRQADDWAFQAGKFFWLALLFATAAGLILGIDYIYYLALYLSLFAGQSGGWVMAIILSFISLAVVISIELALHRLSHTRFARWLYTASLPLSVLLAIAVGTFASVIGIESFVKAIMDPSHGTAILGGLTGAVSAPTSAGWTDNIPGYILSASLLSMAVLMPIVFAIAAGPLARKAVASFSDARHWRKAALWFRTLCAEYEQKITAYFSFMRYKRGFVKTHQAEAKVRIQDEVLNHRLEFVAPLQAQLDVIEKRPVPRPSQPSLPRDEPDPAWLRAQIARYEAAYPTEAEIDAFVNGDLKTYLKSIVT